MYLTTKNFIQHNRIYSRILVVTPHNGKLQHVELPNRLHFSDESHYTASLFKTQFNYHVLLSQYQRKAYPEHILFKQEYPDWIRRDDYYHTLMNYGNILFSHAIHTLESPTSLHFLGDEVMCDTESDYKSLFNLI